MKNSLRFMFMLVLAGMFLLAGCNNSVDSDSQQNGDVNADHNGEATVDDGDTITIEFWGGPTYRNVEGVGDNPEFGDYERLMIEQFEDENPNIEIDYQMIGYSDIEDRTTVALAGGSPPDILLEALDRRLMKYVLEDAIEPIGDFIESDLADFDEGMIDAVSRDGEIYGLPVSMNPEYMFLNKQVFKDKGLEHLVPEDRTWTIDEMKDALTQVSGDGVYGTAFYAANEQGDEMQLMHFFGRGAEQWNEDETQVVMDQYPEAVETLEMMIEMVDDGVAAPGAGSTDVLGVLEMFQQGRVAMIPFAQSLYSAIEAGQADGSISEDFEIYAIKPVHAEGVTPQTAVAGIHGYTVFEQTDPQKREAIKKFLQFMTTTENIEGMAKSEGYVPGRASSYYEVENEDLTAIMEVASDLPQARLGKTSPVYNEVRALWYPELQAAFQEIKTPEEAIRDYTDNANNIIDSQ